MKIKIFVLLILLICFLGFIFAQNNLLVTSKYIIQANISEKLRVVHLSDLHTKSFWEQNYLVYKINRLNPDIIVMTGDMIDERKYPCEGEEPVLVLVKKLNNNYPIYFVTGNHDSYHPHWEDIKSELGILGVKFLENETVEYKTGISISGLSDEIFRKKRFNPEKIVTSILEQIPEDNFSILLSHRPEQNEYYLGFDVCYSGHAHGGQWRIPILLPNGIYAPPNQYFPKLTRGVHTIKDLKLVISRGLGNSRCPLRIFNYPEIVVTDIIPK